MANKKNWVLSLLSICFLGLFGCSTSEEGKIMGNSLLTKEMYHEMKASVMSSGIESLVEESNIFDDGNYDPSADTLDELLINMGDAYRLDSEMVVKFDVRSPRQMQMGQRVDTLYVGKEYFTTNLENITESELQALRHNLDMTRARSHNPQTDGQCRGAKCPVYAHVSKKDQRLYLYMNGEPLDTFKTSTGMAGKTTPNFDTKPDGRMFRKYSSHKFPGGSWHGLGNMPYAVFIKGGYAIHGTTEGNIKILGKPASHGCIRLHPYNAKIFYNLAKMAGRENVWITVDNS